MPYVVRVYRSNRGSPEVFDEYLDTIRHDRYQSGNTITHTSTPEREDAFKFQTLAAAEFAAVFVGGRIEEVPVE